MMLKEIFGDLGKELKAMRDELKPGPRTRTITVAKPYCSPARSIITGALQPYGVKIHGITERPRMAGMRGMIKQMGLDPDSFDGGTNTPLPIAQVAKVTVNEQAAAWAEYLLLRTGKLYCPDGYVNARNEQWAKQHGGTMPPAWNEGKPWIETSCKDGMKAWAPLRKAAKKRKNK